MTDNIKNSTRGISGSPISGASISRVTHTLARWTRDKHVKCLARWTRDKHVKMEEARHHNKSRRISINIGDLPDDVFRELLSLVQNGLHACGEVTHGSPCVSINAQDGRVSYKGAKIAFGYQVIARNKFGIERMKAVAASKTAESLTISHLCGTRNCCNADHLVLETKAINDERTHCHFCLRNLDSNEARNYFLAHNGCRHVPQCTTLAQ